MNPNDKLIDKYHLSLHESQFLLKKNIVALVYNAGKFEGLNTTLLQTEQIIKYNRAKDVAVDEVLTIIHLKRGFEYLLKATDEPLLEKAKKINAIVASEDALFPGRIRNGGVEVSTLQGKYIPKLKDEATIQSDFQKLLDSDYSITEKALRLFLYMSKNQIFWDGNKRTALISANALMYKYGVGLLSIPEADFITFNEYLSNYYHSDQASQERQLLRFMYDHCIFGIDYQS